MSMKRNSGYRHTSNSLVDTKREEISKLMKQKKTQKATSGHAVNSQPFSISKVYYIFAVIATVFILYSVMSSHKGSVSSDNIKNEDILRDNKEKDIHQNDSDYEAAIMKKASARIQNGWFRANSSAIFRIDRVSNSDNIPALIKELSSFSWPAMSQMLHLNESFPLFSWDLTKFAALNSKQKSRRNSENFMLTNTRLQFEPVFVLGSERDKGGMVGSKHDQALVYVNVTMKEFLQSTFREDMYLYWTGELDYFERTFGLKSSISATNSTGDSTDSSKWEDFHVDEPNIEIVENEEEESSDCPANNHTDGSSNKATTRPKSRVRPMIWLSHPGVVAQTHYDTQHNIFIQVQGFKRFHLFPPATELHVYPNIHHSFRQSQIHFERNKATSNETADFFPSVTEDSVEAIEVTLGPGDILYIPPFWQHRVESLTLSLSLSILSPSEIEAAIAELFWLQVPFGGELQQQRSTRIRAVIAYMEGIFRYLGTDLGSSLPPLAADSADNAVNRSEYATEEEYQGALVRHRFAQSLYYSRFAPLNTTTSSASSLSRLCPLQSVDPTHQEALKIQDQIDTEKNLLRDARGNFEEAAGHFVATLQQLQAEVAIKRTFLRDYLEQLVRWAVGPQLTGDVLLHCF